MKISFVVSAFGNFSVLRTCLSSLLNQTMQDFEIIVCDNDPESDQEYMAAEIARMDPTIRYEWTADRTAVTPPGCRHRRCLYTAAEIGAARATGEFLCFPNADSYYAPVFAGRMLRAAEACHFDLVYSDFVSGRPECKYVAMESQPRQTKIDKTSFVLRRSSFFGFPDKEQYEQADGMMIERLVLAGISRRRVAECLVFHN